MKLIVAVSVGSVNVRNALPASISRVNESRVGGVRSIVIFLACNGTVVLISTLLRPTISSTAPLITERKVVAVLFPSGNLLRISSRLALVSFSSTLEELVVVRTVASVNLTVSEESLLFNRV